MSMQKTIADLALRWFRRQPEALNDVESRVLKSAVHRSAISHDQNQAFDATASTGERIADAIARVGGSWTFILGFLVFLAVWTLANVWLLGRETFDPYPFVFLNLILSMLAALQAPVIMMSQNRQAARDRLDATHDYEVNLKAEIEIMALHEKLDEIRHNDVLALKAQFEALTAQLDRIERSTAGRPPNDRKAK
jgi:uncharacterized membrane protein